MAPVILPQAVREHVAAVLPLSSLVVRPQGGVCAACIHTRDFRLLSKGYLMVSVRCQIHSSRDEVVNCRHGLRAGDASLEGG